MDVGLQFATSSRDRGFHGTGCGSSAPFPQPFFQCHILQQSPNPTQKGALPPSEPLGSCELFMPVVFRGAAIGGVLALVVQAFGPTPLGAMVRGSMQLATRSVVELPAHAAKSNAAPGIQANAGSLPHLQIPSCQDAVCAGR